MIHPPETLARDRYQEMLRRAREHRRARQLAELRKIERMRNRAERKLLQLRRRTTEIRASLDATP